MQKVKDILKNLEDGDELKEKDTEWKQSILGELLW